MGRSIVVHIDEATCAKYERDPSAVKLVEIAKTFGTVETLDSVLAADRAKNQATINNLVAQNEEIKEYAVTPEELVVLKAMREKSKKESEQYIAAIKQRDDQLEAIRVENENRAATIRALYGL